MKTRRRKLNKRINWNYKYESAKNGNNRKQKPTCMSHISGWQRSNSIYKTEELFFWIRQAFMLTYVGELTSSYMSSFVDVDEIDEIEFNLGLLQFSDLPFLLNAVFWLLMSSIFWISWRILLMPFLWHIFSFSSTVN